MLEPSVSGVGIGLPPDHTKSGLRWRCGKFEHRNFPKPDPNLLNKTTKTKDSLENKGG